MRQAPGWHILLEIARFLLHVLCHDVVLKHLILFCCQKGKNEASVMPCAIPEADVFLCLAIQREIKGQENRCNVLCKILPAPLSIPGLGRGTQGRGV